MDQDAGSMALVKPVRTAIRTGKETGRKLNDHGRPEITSFDPGPKMFIW